MIVVVEPHADDAYLSLGGHIERWAGAGERVMIVTVFSGTRKRGDEAAAYARAVGAEWGGLGFVEGEHRQLALLDIADPADRLIGPLGLRHPEHRMIAAALPASADRYLDVPYQSVQSNGVELAALVEGRRVISWLVPSARKYRHHALFKDQSMFMRYNPPSSLARIPEVIVR